MPSDPTLIAALWGLMGAVVYGGPQFVTSFYSARRLGHTATPRTGGNWGQPIAELAMALIGGMILSAAFGQWVAHLLHQTDARAMSAAMGLFGNPIAPALVRIARDKVVKKVDAGVPL